MDKKVKRLSIIVSIAASMWACDGSSPSSPTEPAAPLPATYALSGVVSEVTTIAKRPVVSAIVEVSSDPRLQARTDATGAYRIDGVPAGLVFLKVYTEDHEIFSRSVTIAGDTRFDIEIDRRPTFTLSGVVSEMTPTGAVPLEGVEVGELEYSHVTTKSDKNGFFSFTGYPEGAEFPVSFAKQGYQTTTSRPTIHGDTRLDVQLVRH